MQNAKQSLANGGYFLANPANYYWLTPRGDPAWDSVQRGQRIGFLSLGCFLSIFVAVGVFMIGVFFFQLFTQAQLQFRGETTRATYVSRDIDTDDDGDTYFVTYRYTVNDTVYTTTEGVSAQFYETAANGEPFMITYARTNPTNSSVNGPEWGLVIFLAFFTLIWNGIIGVAVWAIRTEQAKEKRLRDSGQIIHAELTQISAYDDSDSGYSIKVSYRFVSPLDQSIITGQLNQARSDLRNKELPIPPVPMRVVFLDNKTYKVL